MEFKQKIERYQRRGRVAFSVSDSFGQVFRVLGIATFVVGAAGLLFAGVSDIYDVKIKKCRNKLKNSK